MTYPDYKPLNVSTDEIRLLQLGPQQPEQPQILSCSMRTISRKDNPSYAYLSYPRDDGSSREDITIDGHSVTVTTNIASGLRACRDEVDASLIWVDALCINYLDSSERTAQMGQISRTINQAQGVVAWLGDAADESDRAISEIEKLSIMLQEYYGQPKVVRIADKLTRGGRIKLGGPVMHLAKKMASPPTLDGWIKKMPEVIDPEAGPIGTTADSVDKPNWSRITRRDIKLFTERPYWSCIWTFQEILCSQRVMLLCGSSVLSWEHIDTLAQYAQIFITHVRELNTSDTKPEHGSIASQVASIGTQFLPLVLLSIGYNNGATITVHEMTEATANRHAKDPRDMVFGILGPCQSDIKPDYSQSVEDVYRQVTIDKLRYTGLLQDSDGSSRAREAGVDVRDVFLYPLYLAGLGRQQQSGISSWVQDLTVTTSYPIPPEHCQAARGTEPRHSQAYVDQGSLYLRACFAGEIKEVWEVTKDTVSWEKIPAIAKTWLEDESLPCKRDGKVFDMLRDVLVLGYGNAWSQGTMKRMEPGSAEDLESMGWFLKIAELAIDKSLPQGVPPRIQKSIESRVSQLPAEYREVDRTSEPSDAELVFHMVDVEKSYVSYTTDGKMVSATMRARPGDLLYVIPGHPCPLMMRKTDGHLQIMSWAYVSGIMQGQLVGEDVEAWVSSLEKLEIR